MSYKNSLKVVASNVSPRERLDYLDVIDSKWQLFVRICAVGSFSKAAVLLDMPQSVVSRNVALLESQCGGRLFRRTGRGVVLTELGEYLLPRVTGLLAGAESLAGDILSMRDRPTGEVIVGLLPSAVRNFAGPLFAAAHSQLPGVRLHLAEGASAQLEEQLYDGRLSMAIVLREETAEIRDADVLAEVPLHLVGRADDPLLQHGEIPLDDISGLPLVVPSRPHLLRARLDDLELEMALKLNVSVEADSVRLQQEIVSAGGGYAIASVIPGSLSQDLSSAKIIQPVLKRYVVLAASPRRLETSASRAVRKLICTLKMAS